MMGMLVGENRIAKNALFIDPGEGWIQFPLSKKQRICNQYDQYDEDEKDFSFSKDYIFDKSNNNAMKMGLVCKGIDKVCAMIVWSQCMEQVCCDAIFLRANFSALAKCRRREQGEGLLLGEEVRLVFPKTSHQQELENCVSWQVAWRHHYMLEHVEKLISHTINAYICGSSRVGSLLWNMEQEELVWVPCSFVRKALNMSDSTSSVANLQNALLFSMLQLDGCESVMRLLDFVVETRRAKFRKRIDKMSAAFHSLGFYALVYSFGFRNVNGVAKDFHFRIAQLEYLLEQDSEIRP